LTGGSPLTSLSSSSNPDPVEVFRERAEARALLAEAGALDFHDAVDELQACAEASGLVDCIGQDLVQQIMAEAFK
jgi:hypothetical protein